MRQWRSRTRWRWWRWSDLFQRACPDILHASIAPPEAERWGYWYPPTRWMGKYSCCMVFSGEIRFSIPAHLPEQTSPTCWHPRSRFRHHPCRCRDRPHPAGFSDDALYRFNFEGTLAAVCQFLVLLAGEGWRLIFHKDHSQKLSPAKPALTCQMAGMLEHSGRSQVMNGAAARLGKFQGEEFIKTGRATGRATSGAVLHDPSLLFSLSIFTKVLGPRCSSRSPPIPQAWTERGEKG